MLVARDLWLAPPGGECPAGLRGFSLAVARGEWVAITGPNGSGKSTLALALAGLVPPRRGTVELDGRALDPGHAGSRSRVAIVLQEMTSQLLQATVAEELGFAARNLGRAEAEVCRGIEAWSNRLGLRAELARDPRSLSAGRQQLALIAAALNADPDLLVADEPGAHLDREARARVIEVVRERVQAGLAVVWVTQEVAERAAADRTVVLGDHGDPSGESGSGTRGKPIGSPAYSLKERGEVRVELVVSPRDGSQGPGIETDQCLRIGIGESGVTLLAGRNGSGKSVMLEGAAGLRRIEQLQVIWRSKAEHPPILASQSPELQMFEERVADEVTYAAVSRGLGRKHAIEAAGAHFESLGLERERFLERRCWDLSAGERRLMHVVGALITPASLVLLDEPTCGLDENRRSALARLVQERSRRDPVLVATQDSEWTELLEARPFFLGHRVSTTWQVPAKKTD